MRFTSTIVAGSLAFVASAQSTSVSLNPAQASQVACLGKCDPDDLDCIARCSPVPNPNEDQVETTHKCISKCYEEHDQGTAESIQAFSQCQDKCIAADYWNSSEGTPKPTGGSDDSNDDKEESSTGASKTATAETTVTTGTATVTETGTATESGAEESSTESSTETTGADGAEETGDNAAAGLLAKTAAIVGALAAVFAL
jgi:hypothetical protein